MCRQKLAPPPAVLLFTYRFPLENMYKPFFLALLSLALLPMAHVRAQSRIPIFTGHEVYVSAAPVGGTTSASSVAMGDLNGDGILDCVVSIALHNTVSVRFGNGTGGFTGSTQVSVGAAPISVALGDINQDGRLDLATANSDNTASFRLGDGAGGFGAASTVSIPARPVKILLADMDRDGYPEMIAAGETTVMVRTNYGGQLYEFGYASVNMYGPNTGLATGGVDNDQLPDLVTSTGSNSFSVSTANANGFYNSAFTPFASGGLSSVAIGDINEDGFPDLIASSYNEQFVTVRFNYGSQNYFLVQKDYPVGGNPRDVAVRDINGDGHLDLATANDAQNTVSVRLGDGAGVFTAAGEVPVASRPVGLVVADVNKDGMLDFVTVNRGSDDISVRLNTTPPVKLNLRSSQAFAFNAGVASLSWKPGNATEYVAFVREVRPGSAPMVAPTNGVTYSGSTQEIDPINRVAGGTYLLGNGTTADSILNMRNPSIGHVYETAIYEFITDPALGPVYRSAYPVVRTFTAARLAPRLSGSLNSSRQPALSWSVQAQYKSTGMRLQVSSDGLSFTNLGPEQPGVDSVSTVSSQAYAPGLALSATTYYRVELTHTDGVTLYSNVVRLVPPTPLPVELLRFTATTRPDDAALLSWTTASEKNSAYFEVERSSTGRDFEVIGTVAAAGTSAGVRSYQLIDARLRTGTTYYRLRQVDADKTFSYSPVAVLRASASGGAVSLYPNPASNGQRVTLRLPAAGTGDVHLLVQALASSQVLVDRKLSAGSSELSWTLEGFSTGVYLIDAECAGKHYYARLLVQ